MNQSPQQAPGQTPALAATFDEFGLHPDIRRAIVDQGYTQPTPIQVKAIPIVLEGRDVMGAAQTGTGKTAAFTLPIIQLLMPHGSTSMSPARHPVRALILTPTRELADQVAENAHNYSVHTPLRSAVVFGGVDIQPQKDALRKGVEILIATPGRLLDHVEQRTANLSQVQILVLDEADRMLDMGFLPDLQRIINLLPKQRQTLLFSATFSPEIKKLAASYLRDPVTIEVARQNATNDNVRQVLYALPNAEAKRAAITHILREREGQGLSKQVIVFSNSKIGASKLALQLQRDGINAGAIHGDKSQTERMQTLEAFKTGTLDALVATDVAARGLDIPDMPCVINADIPFNAEDYVHRIGRTGRAGASGDAISLCSPSDEKLLADIEKLIKKTLPRMLLEGFDPVQHGRLRGPDDGRGRRRRDEDGLRGGAHAYEPVPRVSRGQGRTQEDPFFLKPYEPAPRTAASGAPDSQPTAHAPVGGKPRRQVGALLGGLVRKG